MTQSSRRPPMRALAWAPWVAALGWPGVGVGAGPSDRLPANAPLLRAAIVVPHVDHHPAEAPSARTVASTQAPHVAAERSRPSPQVVAEVERFGFESRAAMGIGGFITMKTVPIALFRDGSVAKDVRALTHPGGPQAHRAAHPRAWAQWRRTAGKLEISTPKGWATLPLKPYAKVPDGLKLRGLFRRLGGTGNIGVGGTSSVTVTNEYRFTADGRVQRGGSAGSTAEAGGTSVVTQQVAPNRRGRYRVEGLMLLIDYDDGSHEQRLLVTDPQDPDRALWLDGQDYVRRGD